MADFSTDIDYFEELKESEKFDGEYPLLRGLQRLAHSHRGGIKRTHSQVFCTPARDNPIASVGFTIEFHDGTEFSGVADATPKAHKEPFSRHLVAVAESKAESRALRRAFNISKVAKEEIGDEVVGGDPENGPINDGQLSGIKKVAQRKGLKLTEVLPVAKIHDAKSLDELTYVQAQKVLKALNKYKKKK